MGFCIVETASELWLGNIGEALIDREKNAAVTGETAKHKKHWKGGIRDGASAGVGGVLPRRKGR